MTAIWPAVAVFAGTLWASRARQDRARFEAWQKRQLDRWLARDLPRVAFYADAPRRLHDLPVIDKAMVMARFQDFNRGGITAEQGWQAFAAAGRIGTVSIGASTGTSGNRMLYAVTPEEQARWVGTMLAKTVPGFLWQPERVAVILPQASALYDSARRTRRLKLQFFDLGQGIESWADRLTAFAPTCVIAPPRVLRRLAELPLPLSPRRLYSGAETLDPIDRAVIEARFGLPLGQIYMATEGLFAVTCPQGRLHLAEDSVHFEFLPVGNGLVTPLITGFRRRFQIMARYRMNDLLRLSPHACPCGSPLRVVEEVVGRMDDSFTFDRADGTAVLVTPDVLRNAVLDAARDITDFRIWRESRDGLVLILPPEVPAPSAQAAQAALQAQIDRRGLAVTVSLRRAPLGFDPGRKLRRVENRWPAGGGQLALPSASNSLP